VSPIKDIQGKRIFKIVKNTILKECRHKKRGRNNEI
jgi:hypothetical protein